LIVVIEQGRIAEQGTHRELLARRGRYFALYTNQFAADRERALLHLERREMKDAEEAAQVAAVSSGASDDDA
jgi:hypothetical protein